MIVIGYVRVSTDEQARSGLGAEAQRAHIAAEADRRGWQVRWIEDKGWSGKSLKRPGVQEALAALKAGDASVLLVAKLDRLSRSLLDFAGTMDLARKQGWELVALDLGVDTTTPTGRLVASVMASVAEWERETIGQRTRDALAVKRAQGVRLGRPRSVPDAVLARIRAEYEAGSTYEAIAQALNTDHVPTAHGGAAWHGSTVAQMIRAAARDVA